MKTFKMAVEIVEIQKRYTKKAMCSARIKEQEMAAYLKLMGEKLGALLGGSSWPQDENQRNEGKQMWSVTCAIRKDTSDMPTQPHARERYSPSHHIRRRAQGQWAW